MKAFLFALALAAAASAQTAPPAAVIRHAGQIQWSVSGSLPPGAEYHLIYEDPRTHALQTLARFPSGYALPPHWLTHDETLYVVSGKLVVEVDGKPETLTAGSYAAIPAGVAHSLKAKGTTTMLMSLNGPFEVKGLPSVKQ